MGITTVEALARADHAALARTFGARVGPGLRVLGLGGDDDPVTAEPWIARSRGKEVTYERDLRGREAVAAEIDGLTAALMDEVERDDRAITHVAVKIRWATFFTRSRIVKLPAPTTDAARVRAGAAELLDRFAAAGFDLDRPIRLLGVRVLLQMPAQPAVTPSRDR
jgi:DNA polymerase-4